MNKLFFLIIYLLVILGCAKPHYDCAGSKSPRQIMNTSKEGDVIKQKCVLSFIKKMEINKGLKLIYNAGFKNREVENSRLSFASTQKLVLENCRKLIIEMAVDFADHINNDISLRPYLMNYPVTVDKFDIGVSFYWKEKYFEERVIKMITLMSGKIDYSIDTGEIIYADVHRETFRNALDILRSQNCAPSCDERILPEHNEKNDTIKQVGYTVRYVNTN